MWWIVDPVSLISEEDTVRKNCPKLQHCGKHYCSGKGSCAPFTRKDEGPKKPSDKKE